MTHKRNYIVSKKSVAIYIVFNLTVLFTFTIKTFGQGEARANARISANQITIGDHVRVFLEAQHNPSQSKLQWAVIPDSVNSLEILEKGKIDTVHDGNIVTYRQKLVMTGFDSGIFNVPAFVFSVVPNDGSKPYEVSSDSFQLLVQSVAVDTTKPPKPIKGIIFVKTTWLDYLGYVVATVVALAAIIIGVLYYLKKIKKEKPAVEIPKESLFDFTMRQLNDLEQQKLWQNNKVKEYYVGLTDIVRGYIERRFETPAMELTTDELLEKAKIHVELMPYYKVLSNILHTADLAKFAKAQPLPQEHVDCMDNSKKFIESSRPVVIVQPSNETTVTA